MAILGYTDISSLVSAAKNAGTGLVRIAAAMEEANKLKERELADMKHASIKAMEAHMRTRAMGKGQ